MNLRRLSASGNCCAQTRASGDRSQRSMAAVAACTLTGALLGLAAPAATLGASTAASNKPLAPSNYSTQQVCGAAGPGQARCLAVRLVPRTAAARAHNHPIGMSTRRVVTAGEPTEGVDGLTPEDLHRGYNLPAQASSQQTIALVDAYNDPDAENDLEIYSKEFGLPLCTKANGCFRQINQEGNTSPLPTDEGGWSLEISLDIETAHAVCPNCKILLVEANSEGDRDLEAAENTAVAAGATEVSNSYGGGEAEGQDPAAAAYNHQGVVITASAGDQGYDNWDEGAFHEIGASAEYPASSPDVVAVGGTRLELSEGTWIGESVWNDGSTEEEGENGGAGGGGCSTKFTAPLWQQEVSDWSEVGCGSKRAVADVSADADPYTGLAVYDTEPYPEGRGTRVLGWTPVGGTSLASPIIAATFALAGGAQGVAYPASTLYAHLGTRSLHDVTVGSNGECTKEYDGETGVSECTVAEEEADCASELICVAHAGYDGPSGVGTPDGTGAFEAAEAPAVSSIAPDHGSDVGNKTVTITGTNFVGGYTVKFGETPGTDVAITSATELTVKTPAHANGTVDVTVTTGSGTSPYNAGDHYSFEPPPRPVVSSMSPREGSVVGDEKVTIRGQYLEGATAVKFDEAAAGSIDVISETEMTVEAPAAHAAGKVNVTVTTPGGTSEVTESDGYTYILPPKPVIASVSPVQGSTDGGEQVTITGENFRGTTAVKFGAEVAPHRELISATQMIVTTPAHSAGTVNVTVTTPGGTSEVSEGEQQYTYVVEHLAALPLLPTLTETPATETPATNPPVGSVSTVPANSDFTVVGKHVNRKTGAVTLTVAVFDHGSLRWSLSFAKGSFGKGTTAVSAAEMFSFTVRPGTAARRALAKAARKHRPLAVTATVTYTAAGGPAVSHVASVAVHLR